MPGRSRSTPEWITFAVSALVVGAVIVVLLAQLTGSNHPASPVAVIHTASITRDGDRYRVPVSVRNTGDRTATNTQVVATLHTTDDTETAEQTIDFLGADETAELVFLFTHDPSNAALTVDVTGYAEP